MMRRLCLKLDPRVQVLWALTLSGVALAAPWPGVWVAVGLGWAAALGVLSPGDRLRLIRSVALLAGITVALGAWMGGDRGQTAWYVPTAEGALAGVRQGLRVSALAAGAAWLVSVLSLWRLSRSLEWMLRRHPSWRRRVHSRAFPLVLAWNMIPDLWDGTRRQLEVHRIRRGPEQSARSRFTLLRTLAPGWFHGMVVRAEELSTALTLRGYTAATLPGVTPFSLGRADAAVLGVMVIMLWATLA